MSKKILKYTSVVLGSLVLLIIYLSTVGFETDKFNNQIQNLVKQKNDKFDTSLKKIKLTLDPLNFKINAKTIDAKITSIGKPIELEYIKTQISLNSLIKSQLVASQVEISTKPILLKNFVAFIRSINNRPELFILERFIKNQKGIKVEFKYHYGAVDYFSFFFPLALCISLFNHIAKIIGAKIFASNVLLVIQKVD